ncbi:hypothetical protein KFE98_17235 [bacterium SCSIO 12741]|nr:hypothetical protein KFE98_17235 [bacterium SCSIO 12741]
MLRILKNGILLLWLPLTGHSQDLVETLLVTDTKDSHLINTYSPAIDIDGNYCFDLDLGDDHFFITKDDTLGPLPYISKSYGSGGEFTHTKSYRQSEDEPWYFKNGKGTSWYGPVKGKEKENEAGASLNGMSVVVEYHDSVFYYANNRLTSKVPKEASNWSIEDAWVWMASDGEFINQKLENGGYRLYLNDSILLHESENDYYKLRLNSKGDYLFAEGRKPGPKEPYDYDYMFFLHTRDSVFGPVRTEWNCYLQEDGAYYFSGDDAGPEYILINNDFYRDLRGIKNITLRGPKSYLFTYIKKNQNYVCVNGKSYPIPYDQITYPSLDEQGNFAFYGERDYYLYKFVNGREIADPISKYGVRPMPLHIDPTGHSTHVFRTDDSVYFYQDDSLLFRPFAKQEVKFENGRDILGIYGDKDRPNQVNYLGYIELDGAGYWLNNNTFSRPMLPALQKSWDPNPKKGEIEAAGISEKGFYIIQRTGRGKWIINLNNQHYLELKKVDQLTADNFYLEADRFVCYGFRGLSLYRFEWKL